jgi:hypothetical protein
MLGENSKSPMESSVNRGEGKNKEREGEEREREQVPYSAR